MGIKNILGYRLEQDGFEELVKNWNKAIIVEIKDIYEVAVIFAGESITITTEIPTKFDLKFILDLETMGDIARGKIGAIKAFMQGRVKVKKLLHVGTLLKFMKIFIPALQMAGERANHYKLLKARTSNYEPAIRLAEESDFPC